MTGTTNSISTHVLDTSLGRPAAGIAVVLRAAGAPHDGGVIGRAMTDADGRVVALVPPATALEAGTYELTFSVGSYFATAMRESFYEEIVIRFHVAPGAQHYHVPLLLSPFGYSTYRGS